MSTTRWEPERGQPPQAWPHPPLLTAVGRGLACRCPGCGKAHLFNGFLKVVKECTECGAPLGLARADDAPPYFTIFVTGHVIIPLMFMVDRMGEPPIWLMSAIFLPLTIILCLALIRPIKGGTVGLMLNLNMLKNDPTER